MRIAGSPDSNGGSSRIGTGSCGTDGNVGVGRLGVGTGTGTNGTAGGALVTGGVGSVDTGGGAVYDAFTRGGTGCPGALGAPGATLAAVSRWHSSAAGSAPTSSELPVVI